MPVQQTTRASPHHGAQKQRDPKARKSIPWRQRRLGDTEIRRKIWHTLPGVLAFVLPAFPHSQTLQWYELAAVAARAAILSALVLIFFRMIARPNERGRVAAVLGYAGTVLGTLLLFPSHPEFAATVLAVIAFGDSAAEVFGVYFGRRTLPWNRAKTWAGLTGFVLCGTPLATAAFWWAANPTVPLLYAALRGASATLAGALAESLPSPIGDNLLIGLAAALTLATL